MTLYGKPKAELITHINDKYGYPKSWLQSKSKAELYMMANHLYEAFKKKAEAKAQLEKATAEKEAAKPTTKIVDGVEYVYTDAGKWEEMIK